MLKKILIFLMKIVSLRDDFPFELYFEKTILVLKKKIIHSPSFLCGKNYHIFAIIFSITII